MNFSDLIPLPITEGPPLPRVLDPYLPWNGYWPWYKKPEPISPADITLANLSINPTEVNAGATVTISCTATNVGGISGSYIVSLGGDFMVSKTISLQPGESQSVSFQVTAPAEVGVYHVSVDGLNGQFTVTTAPVADIRLSNLVISPAVVNVTDTVTISVTATNYGNVAGSRTINMEVT